MGRDTDFAAALVALAKEHRISNLQAVWVHTDIFGDGPTEQITLSFDNKSGGYRLEEQVTTITLMK